MKYSVGDFRTNIRKALNDADEGREVIIERFGNRYSVEAISVNVKENDDGTVSQKKPGKPFVLKSKPLNMNEVARGSEKRIDRIELDRQYAEARSKADKQLRGKLCEHDQLKGDCLVKGCPHNTRF